MSADLETEASGQHLEPTAAEHHDPIPDVVAAKRRRASYGLANVWLPTGRITAYSDRFEAVCMCRKHRGGNRCVITRMRIADSKDASTVSMASLIGRGRPLGLMAAWLARCHRYGNRDKHRESADLEDWPLEERTAARSQLELCEGAAELLGHERHITDAPGEPMIAL